MKRTIDREASFAAREEIIITRHGRAAGVLIGFETEDDWLEYRLENHPEFLEHIAQARAAVRAGRGVSLDELDDR